jgi:hypothetical protein
MGRMGHIVIGRGDYFVGDYGTAGLSCEAIAMQHRSVAAHTCAALN